MSDQPSFDAVLGGLGSKAVDALKLTLGEAWDSFSEAERAACTHLLFMLAKAHLRELAGYDVKDELQTLSAAYLQWRVVGKQVLVDGMNKVAHEAFGLAGSFLAGAVSTFVKTALK